MQIDFSELWERTILSQYSTSPHIKGIIEKAAERIDPFPDIRLFYYMVFNPKTARGVGLDIWGRIVGATRYLEVENETFFGFRGSLLLPFGQAPFINEKGKSNVRWMEDSAYRDIIFLKAAANIGDATLPSIKRTLTSVFGATVLALEGLVSLGNMTIRIVFTKYLTPYQRALLREYGILNIGAGVGFEYYQVEVNTTFGFRGSDFQPFNQGVFQVYPIQKWEDE